MKNVKTTLGFGLVVVTVNLVLLSVSCSKSSSGPQPNAANAAVQQNNTSTMPLAAARATSCEKVWVEKTETHAASCNGTSGQCTTCPPNLVADVVPIIEAGNQVAIQNYFINHHGQFINNMPAEIYVDIVEGRLDVFMYNEETEGNSHYILFKEKSNGEVAFVYEYEN